MTNLLTWMKCYLLGILLIRCLLFTLKSALGGCDEAAFSAAMKEEMQVCDLEITRSFALLATSDPASDPNLIDLSDMYAWRDTIRNDYNAGGK